MTVTYTVGDTREVIKGIADGSVDLIATSPPFLALRSYVPADHESKGDEIGSERNPAEFIDMLLGLTAEWGRVLAPHGSIAIELGDTYSGSGGAGGDYNEGGLRDGQGRVDGSQARRRLHPDTDGRHRNSDPDRRELRYNRNEVGGTGWPRAKSLALIPQLYAIALAYGINPLTGQPSPAGRWLVRNVIVWHRPNPAVGALGDKVRPSTSYIVVATRSPKRWFDLTAVRTERPDQGVSPGGSAHSHEFDAERGSMQVKKIGGGVSNPAGAPPLDAWFDHYDGTHDTWTLTTQPSRISVKIPTRVPCGPDDGGERTTSPDCPVHGDRADLVPTARCDEHSDAPSSRTSRTGARREPGQRRADLGDASTNTDSGSAAIRCDTRSSRTAPALSTNQPDTPSAQTAADTAHTSTSPESSGDHPDTSASSNGEVCPLADVPETAPHIDHTSDPESACSCTFHLVKDSIHSHYAMWPAKLAERLILMMCPREVCRICGEPRRRVETVEGLRGCDILGVNGGNDRGNGLHGSRPPMPRITRDTTGWTDCGCLSCPNCRHSHSEWTCDDHRPHDHYRPGLVLDPFVGSGTTICVADLHGRDGIGVDFDPRNREIWPKRMEEVRRALFGTMPELPGQIGMFDEVPA